MRDQHWRELEREARGSPGDKELVARAIQCMRRSQVHVPSDLLDLHVHEARSFESHLSFEVSCELPAGEWEDLGSTPGQLHVPASRVWWVRPRPIRLTPQVIDVVLDHEVPGLSLGNGDSSLIRDLIDLPGLTWLSLKGAKVDAERLEQLPALPALCELDLSGCKADSRSLNRVLGRFPNLVRLNVDTCRSFKDWSCLSAPPYLRRLSMRCAAGSERVLRTLPALARLTHLNLNGARVTSRGIPCLAPLTGLRELILEPTHAAEQALEILGQLSELRALHLRGGVHAESLVALTALHHLEYLEIHAGSVADLSPLSALPNLKRLVVSLISDVDAMDLSRIPNLTRLWLSGSEGLSSRGLRQLLDAPSLREVEVCFAHGIAESELRQIQVEARERGVEFTLQAAFPKNWENTGCGSPWVVD